MPINLVRNVLWLLALAGFVIGVLRLTALRWWQVPEDDIDLVASVAPTLGPGDWVILWRLTPPGFGDLVLCPDPENAGEVVVGRIVGEGGDTLSISEDGDLEVNNVRMRSERSCKRDRFVVENPRSGEPMELRCDIETLGGVHHQRAMMPTTGLRPMPVKVEVEAGDLFLVSDNRYHPFDSRDFGAVPKASCSEAVVFRLVSRLGFTHVDSRLSWIQ
jgi:signal peptidase I